MVRESTTDSQSTLQDNDASVETSSFVMVERSDAKDAEAGAPLRWRERIASVSAAMDDEQFGEARSKLLAALQIRPNDPLCRAMLGHCTAATEKDPREGLPMCEAAAREARRPEILYHLGSIHLIQGNRRKAVQIFHDALALDPRYVPILAKLEEIGRRKPPVLPFLSRDNSLNMRLGRMLTRMGKR